VETSVTETLRIRLKVAAAPVAGDVAPGSEIAVLVVAPPPARLAERPTVLFCLPGGSLTKAYFDLQAEGDRSFSFAEAMAERGWITIALDHPGVGESSRPEDGYLLTPAAVAAVDAEAISRLKAMLRAGLGDLPPLTDFRSIGVGHSMGGMLAGFVQANFAPFEAVAILGSGVHGLVQHLPEPLKALAGDPYLARRELVPRMKAMDAAPYRRLVRTPLTDKVFAAGEPGGLRALKQASTELIVVCGWSSMTPGSWAPEAAALRTPLLVLFGDADLCPNPHLAPSAYSACPDLTLAIVPDTGHNHFVYATRAQAFDRIASWVQALP
jgi:alpha-beta hydrolase superfamily lysophospholipase